MDDSRCVGLYARVSSQRQADEMTIQSQTTALHERIIADGCLVEPERCFVDDGFSGGTLVRPALERLRDVAWAGGLDQLYVHSPDRLARKYAYQVLLLEEFAKHGVTVCFLNHDVRGQSPEGNLLLQMQGMIAEYERAKILERTRRGRRFAARQGKVSALAHAPYGYRYVPKHQGDGEARYEIVPEDAQVVKEMFTWVGVQGLSLGEVVDRLAEVGVATATGKARWDRATVRGILARSTYTGTAKYPRTRLLPRSAGRRPQRGAPAIPRRDKVARPTSPDEQESISVPAIVSQELFDAVAERLEENRCRHREQKKGSEFLLSGLLVCQHCHSAYCGRRYRRARSATRYTYYHCLGADKYRHGGEAICANPSINGTQLEESVWRDVRSLLRDPARLRDEFERRRRQPADATGDVSDARKTITRLKGRIARLIDAYEHGNLSQAEFGPRIRRAKDRLAAEEETLAKAHRAETLDDDLHVVLKSFERFSAEMSNCLDAVDFATKRALLRTLIKQIEVAEEEVRIVYRVQPIPFVPRPRSGGFLQHCLKLHSKAQGRPPGRTLGVRGQCPHTLKGYH